VKGPEAELEGQAGSPGRMDCGALTVPSP